MNNGLVVRLSIKQTCIASSMSKSKYVAAKEWCGLVDIGFH